MSDSCLPNGGYKTEEALAQQKWRFAGYCCAARFTAPENDDRSAWPLRCEIGGVRWVAD